MSASEDVFVFSVTTLAAKAHANSVSKGFWRWHEAHKHEPESVILWKLSRFDLMHSEIAEATEGVRKGLPDDHLPHRSMEAAEMADTVIRIFDYCAGHGIPLAEVILEKMEYNAGRPFMHGDNKA